MSAENEKGEDITVALEADVKLTNIGNSIMTMAKAIIGGGLLGLPYAFLESGWVLGLIAFPLIAVLTGYCMILLIHIKDYCHLNRTTTPSDIGFVAFGMVGRRVIDVVLTIDALAACLSYFMFITHNMEIITGMRQEAWAAIFFVILLLVSFARPIKLISYFAYFANVCVGVGIILLVIAVFIAMEPSGEPHSFNWSEFPIFLGIVLFAFQAIELALPVHNSMKNGKKFPIVMIVVLSFCCVLYLVFGLIAYIRLRDNSLSMITEAIDVDNYFGMQIAICVLFIISLFVNILCWIFPVYEIADRLFRANKYRVLSRKEQMRILRENENLDISLTGGGGGGKGDASTSPPGYVTTTAGGGSSVLPSPSTSELSSAIECVTEYRGSAVTLPPAVAPAEEGAEGTEGGGAAAGPTSAVVVVPSTESKEMTDSAVSTSTGTPTSAAPPPPEEEGDDDETFLQNFTKNIKFWCLTTLGRIVTLLIIVIPSVTPVRHHFSNFLGLTGCTTGIFMTFIFPPSCRLRVEWKTLPTWHKIVDIIIVTVSIPAMVYVTVVTLIDLVKSMQAEDL